ncbi:MAG: hypothetical protein J0G35_05955 [Acidobacteriales bacterium]|nr:hypothetical protein [Terriglobales bacterium]
MNKEIDRLTKFRDALLEGSPGINVTHAATAKPGRKPGPAKKAAGVRKSASVKTSSLPKKRTLSAAGRKAISEAAKARWAAKKKATSTK